MSKDNSISVDKLCKSDLETFPVWTYTNSDKSGELIVRPVKRIPVENLSGKIVALQVKLANGTKVLATISNIDVSNPELTKHFLGISFLKRKRWFHLARYHDFDYKKRGPEQLSKFLEIKLDDIFPIAYDLSKFSKGHIQSLAGIITKEPDIRYTRAEIIALAVPRVQQDAQTIH